MSVFHRMNASECIGATPVVELSDPLLPPAKKLFLKIEYSNPNLSIKDRTALGMVTRAMERGQLRRGGTLIESTSGNLGKSFAMLGAIFGFRVIVVVDPKVGSATMNWYKAYGAEVVRVEPVGEPSGYQQARIKRVKELIKENPEAYWPNQYDNRDNADYHFSNTGPEVYEAVQSVRADAVVGCVSTGGHMSGIGRWVKSQSPSTRIIASDVAGSCIFGGVFSPYLINGVGLSWRSGNTDLAMFDGVVIGTDIQAISMCRIIARDHGLLLGGSSGLAVFAAIVTLVQTSASTALAILPDSGVNYLDQFYDQGWLEERRVVPYGRERMRRIDGRTGLYVYMA